MLDFRKQKKQKKIATCFLFFGFFVFGIFLFSDDKFDILNIFNYNNIINPVHYNQKKEALAAEDKPMVCRKKTEIKLPFGISAEFGPNEFEIPTGQVADRTEDVAKRVLDQISIIIQAAEQEYNAAREMTRATGQCGIKGCSSPGCETKNKDCPPCLDPATNPDGTISCNQWSQCPWCYTPSCGGKACSDEINIQLQTITAQPSVISSASDRIKGILNDWKPNQPVGYWWLQGCHSNPAFPPVPGCLTEKEFILKELERARSGDYEILGGWERRPPGLNECVIRPQDMEQVIEGQKSGKFLFSCKMAVAAGLISSDYCYGYNEATHKDRSENYYCCE